MLNLIRKSTLLSKQYEKLLIKNLIGVENYSLVKTFFLQTQYNRVFKIQELLYKHFKTKNVRIKIGYVAYHDLYFFFVIYLTYVNMSIVKILYHVFIPIFFVLKYKKEEHMIMICYIPCFYSNIFCFKMFIQKFLIFKHFVILSLQK